MVYKRKERERACRYRQRLKGKNGETTDEAKRKTRDRQRRYRQQKKNQKRIAAAQDGLQTQIFPIEYVQTVTEPGQIDTEIDYDWLSTDER